ncbi:hypothetical protein LTS18_014688 [Coniosporium uncinatum]|uniref:Uncharacterized protein n=1 Tax=Coniosporium uncinatum TaxID=93489 RepID=A0ACC3D8K1_9PEZI|nr:hypothetical protein LTS18_014688 [Coniosporium uncinatum]
MQAILILSLFFAASQAGPIRVSSLAPKAVLPDLLIQADILSFQKRHFPFGSNNGAETAGGSQISPPDQGQDQEGRSNRGQQEESGSTEDEERGGQEGQSSADEDSNDDPEKDSDQDQGSNGFVLGPGFNVGGNESGNDGARRHHGGQGDGQGRRNCTGAEGGQEQSTTTKEQTLTSTILVLSSTIDGQTSAPPQQTATVTTSAISIITISQVAQSGSVVPTNIIASVAPAASSVPIQASPASPAASAPETALTFVPSGPVTSTSTTTVSPSISETVTVSPAPANPVGGAANPTAVPNVIFITELNGSPVSSTLTATIAGPVPVDSGASSPPSVPALSAQLPSSSVSKYLGPASSAPAGTVTDSLFPAQPTGAAGKVITITELGVFGSAVPTSILATVI